MASISAIGLVIESIEAYSSQVAAAMERQSAVTMEISRTVEESSQAAQEGAAQISNVSTEAIETGRRASAIRDGTVDIAGKVAGLRSTLVQVVRTSTVNVDRRVFTRVELNCPATLEVQGLAAKVVVQDLSEQGAFISEGFGDYPWAQWPTSPLAGSRRGCRG